jgi:hypothetical protein
MIRWMTMHLLEAIEEGPGDLKTGSVESQIAELSGECNKGIKEMRPTCAARYSDRAINAVVKNYRQQGWHVQKKLAPRDSFESWVSYPHLQFQRTSFSVPSQLANFLSKSTWYLLTVGFALFGSAAALIVLGGLLLCLFGIAAAAVAIVVGYVVFQCLALFGIPALLASIIIGGVSGVGGVGYYAYRS